MDKIKIERTWLQGSPVQVDNLMGNAFVGEAGAHEFLISGKDNAGNVVPITGSISGKFLSSTMTTFALSGYVTEGVASVTLPSECYGAPGQFVVSIFATNGSTTTCIYCGVGSIFRTSTAAIAYPTTTLPDLTLLINQLDDVIASFPADLTHLLGAIAPTFVDNQPFTAGQYVWYNQVLYRFTADHPAGSWAGSADTVVAVVGTELNSTIRYTQQILTDAQKTVARSNIDAADADDVTDLELTTVQVTPQTFDDNSKSQARSNIGAASSGDLSTLSGLVIQQGGYISDITAAVGNVPTGETVEGQITDLKSAIGTVPIGRTVQGQITDHETRITTLEGDMTDAKRDIDALDGEFMDLSVGLSILEPDATAEDVGKALIAKTVGGNKVTEYEFGETTEIDDTAGEGDTDKTWSADKLSQIKPGLTEDAIAALLNCFAHVAWIDEHGQDCYDELARALSGEVNLVRVEAVFTQGSTEIYTDTPLNDLKAYLVVTKYFDDGTSSVTSDYALLGTLSLGTSTVTVSCGGKTTTFDVIVSPRVYELTASDFIICGINLGYNKDLDGYGYITDTRISHIGFDVLLPGGKSYRFILDATVDSAQVTCCWINQNALDAVANRNTFSRDDVYEPGWQEGQDIIQTPPETINGSPIVCYRPSIRYDANNSPISSTSFLRKLTIIEVG